MSIYSWSQTASSNATADATINWAEGQAPSTINDSARAMMAATAKYRDDIAGAIVTTGTSTAYAVSSYSVFDTLAHLNGQVIAFTPHATNGATVTLNVDSLGAKPLRSAPNAELLAGVLIQGTPYLAVYNNSDGAFYLQGFYGNPYNIPVGASIEYWGSTAPNSSFVFPYGQAISRTVYSYLFNNVFGTAYGAGDGSTTFNIPDIRGRLVACLDNMGGTDSARNSNPASSLAVHRNTIGGAGGEAAHTLAASETPALGATVPSQTIALTFETNNHSNGNLNAFTAIDNIATTGFPNVVNLGIPAQNITVNPSGGAAHNIAQPTIFANRILRII
jgi:microcystin-dependent protein